MRIPFSQALPLILLLLAGILPLRGQDQMLLLNRRFAAQLLAEQDFSRASDEYQKLAFHYSGADSTLATADSLRYLAGLCQRRLGDYSRSNRLLEAVQNRGSGVKAEADLLRAANHYNLQDHAPSLAAIKDLLLEPGQANSRQLRRRDHLLIANYLETGLLPEARAIGTNLAGTDSLRFAEIIDQAGSTAAKNPALAALMSTLVPGSGKIYTGRTWDGITSFILCVFSGWRAWEGFSEAGIKSFDGWLFGVSTAYFYLGNIYGSAVSARLHNQRARSELRRELERIINEEN
ncbi:MAG: hypothetical protein PHD87_05005 [Candidatus Cloacimonetes bacterium]|nr:hypothetical protein [Candidatus Cloacimonadota bacterium]